MAGKIEMIGAIVIAAFRMGFRSHVAPFLPGHCHGEVILEFAVTVSHDHHVAHGAVYPQSVHVQVGHGRRQRVKRVVGVPPGAQQAGFLGSNCQKDDRALGRLRQFAEQAGQGEQPRGAAGIVLGTVVNIIARYLWVGPEVIPVRRVDDRFIRSLAAGDNRYHVI